MKTINIIIIAILFSAGMCLAQGYSDYWLDIGDGYEVVRVNALDIGICKTESHRVVLSPRDYEKVGPVGQYISTPNYIFTKNHGLKPGESSVPDVDLSQEYYFVITKETDVVQGPFNQEEFSQLPEVANLGQLDWQTPENPDPWWIYGYFIKRLIVFLIVAAIDSYWISIPLIVGVFLLIKHNRRKRKEAAQQSGPGYPPQSVGSPDP